MLDHPHEVAIAAGPTTTPRTTRPEGERRSSSPLVPRIATRHGSTPARASRPKRSPVTLRPRRRRMVLIALTVRGVGAPVALTHSASVSTPASPGQAAQVAGQGQGGLQLFDLPQRGVVGFLFLVESAEEPLEVLVLVEPFPTWRRGCGRGGDMAKLLVDDFSTKSKAIARSFVCLSTHPRSTCPVHTSGSWHGS